MTSVWLAVFVWAGCGGRGGDGASPVASRAVEPPDASAPSATPRPSTPVDDALAVAHGPAHGKAIASWPHPPRREPSPREPPGVPRPLLVEGVANATWLAVGGDLSCVGQPAGGPVCWGRVRRGSSVGVALERAVPLAGIPDGAELRGHAWQLCARAVGVPWACWLGGIFDEERGVLSADEPVRVPEADEPHLVALVTNGRHLHDSLCGLDRAGQVWCWGSAMPDRDEANRFELAGPATIERPTRVTGLAGVRQIGLGGDHGCALATGGAVRCWGSNLWGQLGLPDLEPSRGPRLVRGLPAAAELSLGHDGTCARTRSGAVYCWGRFEAEPLLVESVDGELPEPAPETTRPARVGDITDAVQLDVGHSHACAVRRNRRVVCWGRNEEGQLGDGTFESSASPVEVLGLDDALAVDAGVYHTCARRASGAVSCWGDRVHLGTPEARAPAARP